MQKIIVLFVTAIIALIAFKSPAHFTVTGKITDNKGQPIAGVNVSIKPAKIFVLYAANGGYSINAPDEQAVLQFSAVGYSTKTIKIGNKKLINVQLTAIKNELQEVVVTAYATESLQYDSYKTIAALPAINNYTTNSTLAGKFTDVNISNTEYERKKDKDVSADDREGYNYIKENAFVKAAENPLSTFSIDVDAAAYSNVRRLLQQGNLPPAGAVRIEEMVNYFKYDYPQPINDKPFTVSTEIVDCPGIRLIALH